MEEGRPESGSKHTETMEEETTYEHDSESIWSLLQPSKCISPFKYSHNIKSWNMWICVVFDSGSYIGIWVMWQINH